MFCRSVFPCIARCNPAKIIIFCGFFSFPGQKIWQKIWRDGRGMQGRRRGVRGRGRIVAGASFGWDSAGCRRVDSGIAEVYSWRAAGRGAVGNLRAVGRRIRILRGSIRGRLRADGRLKICGLSADGLGYREGFRRELRGGGRRIICGLSAEEFGYCEGLFGEECRPRIVLKSAGCRRVDPGNAGGPFGAGCLSGRGRLGRRIWGTHPSDFLPKYATLGPQCLVLRFFLLLLLSNKLLRNDK